MKIKNIITIFLFVFLAGTYALGEVPAFQENDKVCSPTDCFTVVKKLGEGAFGEVFAVADSQGQKYALKAYRNHEAPGLEREMGKLGDAEREFQRGQALDHPHIVKSIELFSSNSGDKISYNLLLQFVEGTTLSSAKRGTLSKQEAVAAVQHLYDALRYAFSHDLMFLDLHAGNVMLNSRGEIMVIDLASFFSTDELAHIFSMGGEDEEKAATPDNKPEAFAPQQKLASKVEQFARENPQLLHRKKAARQARFAANAAPSTSSDSIGWESYYFDRITAISIQIIQKANMDRTEKIEMLAGMQKLAWEYEEDEEEGTAVRLDHYLDRFAELVYSF